MNSTENQKLWTRVTNVIEQGTSIPVFSATALKLLDVANQEDLDMETIAGIVKADPGLTAKYVRLANTVAFGGKSISSVQDALIRIGLREVRKMASAIGVVDVLSVFHLKNARAKSMEIEWEMFWLHSLLTARLTESLAESFREPTGKEYLAGLLHDVGKLFLQRYFPEEFISSMAEAEAQESGMYDAEKRLYSVTHAEIGWVLAEKWRLHREVTRAIRFHHEPGALSPFNKDPSDPDNPNFLATCVSVADSLANLCKANIQGAKDLENMDFESLPEWMLLQKFTARAEIEVDVLKELKTAQEAIQILGYDSPK
jgi:putative nucleotidyltransferase with HDIG domain